jgi:hypothetical protein
MWGFGVAQKLAGDKHAKRCQTPAEQPRHMQSISASTLRLFGSKIDSKGSHRDQNYSLKIMPDGMKI